jgi:hypothetical protein
VLFDPAQGASSLALAGARDIPCAKAPLGERGRRAMPSREGRERLDTWLEPSLAEPGTGRSIIG